jgi:hypothetical protein
MGFRFEAESSPQNNEAHEHDVFNTKPEVSCNTGKPLLC